MQQMNPCFEALNNKMAVPKNGGVFAEKIIGFELFGVNERWHVRVNLFSSGWKTIPELFESFTVIP